MTFDEMLNKIYQIEQLKDNEAMKLQLHELRQELAKNGLN